MNDEGAKLTKVGNYSLINYVFDNVATYMAWKAST